MSDLDFRASVVGASEVAALFDACPYLTHFELWHRKKGTIATPEFDAIRHDGTPENERTWWGIRLEGAIIEAARERYGYTDREQLERLDNGKGLGGHPDRRVICPERGPGILEVKTVDWLQRKEWGDEPPLHYLLQSQTYQGLDRVSWGDVIVLVGGNKLERFQYEFRPKVFASIEARVVAFWESIKADQPPKPNYTRDLAALKELHSEQVDEVIDLQSDNRAAIAAAEYLEASAELKAAQARKDAAQAELVDKLGSASLAFASGFQIRSTLVKPVPDREAVAGEIIKGRKAYRRMTVKEFEQ
jgi:predicted phage-related endonuclease